MRRVMLDMRAPLAVLAGAAVLAGFGCTGAKKPAPAPSGGSTPVVEAPPAPERPESAVRYAFGSEGLPEGGMWKCDPWVGDIDGDGIADLAIHPRLGYGPRIFLGRADGGWREASEGLRFAQQSCGGGIECADMNGDGLLDVVVADHCNGLYVFLADGAGNWIPTVAELFPSGRIDPEQPDVSLSMVKGMEDLALGDVDGDGDVDVATGGSDDAGLMIWLNDGSGAEFALQENDLVSRGWAVRVSLADMNGDGMLDLAATHSEGPVVYLNGGNGLWAWDSAGLPVPMMQGVFMDLDIGDADGDGDIDLLVANWINGPELFLRNEQGGWTQAPDLFPQMRGGSTGVAFGDVDGDGDLDIATAGRLDVNYGFVRGAFVLRNDGDGRWSWPKGSGLPETGLGGTWGVTLADLNGDATLDFILGSGLGVESPRDGSPTRPLHPQTILIWLGRPVSAAAGDMKAPAERKREGV